MAELTIEDDDGFVTVWPWPDSRLALANGDFVAICEQQHDLIRAARVEGEEQTPT